MMAYVIRRVLAAAVVMGAVALFVFLLLRLSPGDPAAIIAGDVSSPEQLSRMRDAMGLERPLLVQFGIWLDQLLHGDLGVSLMSGIPVTRLIAQRLEPTLVIGLSTIIFTVLVAVPMGAIAAWNHKRWPDRLVSAFCVLGFSVPFFVVGYLLVLVFSIELRLLPVQGYRSLSDGLSAFLSHQIMPVLTLSFPLIALIARTTRASMLDVLGEDYIRTARAKGLRETVIIVQHALRNGAVPIVTVIGNSFALLIGGVIVTETIFNLPGIGRLTVDAVLARDYPTIQGIILLTSGVYVVLNLLIDLIYLGLDPRIRYQ